MYFQIAILVLIAILMFLLYRRICYLVIFVKDELSQDHSRIKYDVKIKDFLVESYKMLDSINENTRNTDFALNCVNPAGENSANSKRHNALIKLYSNKLIEKMNLSMTEAIARAAFEFSEFDNEKLIEKINGGYWGSGWDDRFKNRQKIKEAFLETGLLTKDCMAKIQDLIPHDLCLPVWILFKKYSSNLNVDNMQFKISRDENSYDDYVKNRAIVLKLMDIGIISKAKPNRQIAVEKSGDFWLDWPCIKFIKNDLNEIKTIIYQGNSAHDDEHFEERFNDAKQAHFFKDYESIG
jgi:hypothetical protein